MQGEAGRWADEGRPDEAERLLLARLRALAPEDRAAIERAVDSMIGAAVPAMNFIVQPIGCAGEECGG